MNSKKLLKMMLFIINTKNITRFLLVLFSFFLIGNSFAAQNPEDIVASKSDYLQPLYKKLFKSGQRNAVLNYMEIGSLAFKHKDLAEANIAFDNAIRNIELIYKDDPNIEKARSLWYEESIKDFKGEPYERVMAYYYRGLSYLIEGDVENARAMFVGGLLQDAFAEEKQHRADFAIMMYLSAWSAMKMNAEHLWESSLKGYQHLRPSFPLPKPDDNVLVIVETGKAPRKLADGIGKYELVYRKGKKFKDKQAQLTIKQTDTRLYPVEDLFWQASTRGGRAVDRIIKGKVQFSESSRNVGDALSQTGNTLVEWSALGDSSNTLQGLGTAISVIGLASKMVSLNIETKADTRYWKSLPNTIHVHSFKSDNINDIQINALDKYGNVLSMKKLKTNIFPLPNKYTIIWAKSQ